MIFLQMGEFLRAGLAEAEKPQLVSHRHCQHQKGDLLANLEVHNHKWPYLEGFPLLIVHFVVPMNPKSPGVLNGLKSPYLMLKSQWQEHLMLRRFASQPWWLMVWGNVKSKSSCGPCMVGIATSILVGWNTNIPNIPVWRRDLFQKVWFCGKPIHDFGIPWRLRVFVDRSDYQPDRPSNRPTCLLLPVIGQPSITVIDLWNHVLLYYCWNYWSPIHTPREPLTNGGIRIQFRSSHYHVQAVLLMVFYPNDEKPTHQPPHSGLTLLTIMVDDTCY